MSKNYQIKVEDHLKIERTSNGIEYSWYEGCDVLIDGGIIEDTNLTDEQALKEVLDLIGFPKTAEVKELEKEIEESCNMVFKDNESKIPLTREELAEIFWDGNREKIEKYGYPIERIAGDLCDCDGHGRFILEKQTDEDRKIGQKKYMKCKICGNYSHL